MDFDWDPAKAAENLRRHKVSFEEAATVFFDDLARVASDPEHSRDEDRFVIVGYSSKQRLLLVVHCYRDRDQVIRLISARTVTKKERKEFEEGL
jgi:uncharacterized DUF497 family protein